MQNNKLIALFAVIIGPISGLGIDIFVPSLPAITQHFLASSSQVQLSVGLYILGYSVFQTVWGTLSDSFGRRPMILIGLIGVMLCCLLIPFSINIEMLLVLRFLQGVFVEPIGLLARTLLSDTYQGEELKKYSTYMTITWSIGPIIAPFIGGYLQHYFGWQASFFFLAAYSLILLLFALKWLPETHYNRSPLSFTHVAAAYKQVFTHRLFLSSIAILSLIYGTMAIFNVAGPFLIQTTLKYSAIVFGRAALLLGVAWFLGSFFNRWLNIRYSTQQIATGSIFLLIVSTVLLLITSFFTLNLWNLLLPIFFVFFAGAIVFGNFFAYSVSLFTANAGAASAVMGTLFVGGAGIISTFSSLLPTQTALPLAVSYIAIVFVIVVMYSLIYRKIK